MSLTNLQQFFKEKKSVRSKVGCVKDYLYGKEVCDLSVQKAFCVIVTGVCTCIPPGEVVTVLCYVDGQ